MVSPFGIFAAACREESVLSDHNCSLWNINLVNRRTRPGSPEKSLYLCFKAGKERLEEEDVFKQIVAGLPRAGLRDPHRMNLNQVLVKQGWCWWDRKYVPMDTFP
jgi:hypothetical protein